MSCFGGERLRVVEGRSKNIHRFKAIFDFEKIKKIWDEGALAHDDVIAIFYILKKDDGENKVQIGLVEKD